MTTAASPARPVCYARIILTAAGVQLPRQHFLVAGSTPAQINSVAIGLRDAHDQADNYLNKTVPAAEVPEHVLLQDGQSLPLDVELSWFDNDLGKVDWSKLKI
ncbi:MAG: hypothetical protein KKC29_00035 [Alphaproteobacteria bacterium]|jgi:hypothetical protein|uniref:Uncharacterized protein n=1 Tax=Brevundimonas aurantiaca TaxID=74316 RepID=A0A7W9F771_9CAUL|nr:MULTISPECIES: hypothetical protein [Brevundimonas]MBU1538818.1 hypothetical protein [Alphaproteobacteria bacterium]ALJ09508.1 hypothetical protein JL11_15075 [Brevundimonas sp. DS20]MBB5738625.1 hypothetical protein [Brevundimonas aurantiaca]MBU2042865.1 hypothetical protein [Alphaproteobacteria bacterium]MBU2127238.1 hypothetical protein [Alphaproteobacteria bacterium]